MSKPVKPKSEYAIQTVSNAFRMLEAFDDETEIGVSDLARRLGLHKNNAFRLLATLELHGYIQQSDRSELYRLGPRCLELGRAYARAHGLTREGRPVVEALAARVGETAHLGALSEDAVVHLDAAQPEQLVLSAPRVGRRLPAYCTALGKCLLAASLGPRSGPVSESADARATEALLSGEGLEARTEHTLVDATKLLDELRSVALQGYAVDAEETERGLVCVAAPVRDDADRIVAALSVSGPTDRLTANRRHGEIAQAVMEAAAELSRRLGAQAT